MIHPIDSTEATEATRQAPRANVSPATTAGKNFATVLAHEKKNASDVTGPHDKLPIVAPEHEVWQPVRGDDHYAKIVDGPRAGMYVNLSRGDRRGEVFKVEMRDGKRVHVYGEGDKEFVIAAKKDSGFVPGNKKAASAAEAPKGEQWMPVKGANNYADILNGRRNGYFVNTSGGVRDGMAFQIVRKGNKTYHVYGSGANKQMIEVHAPKKATKTDDTSSASAAASSNGGVRAPGASAGTGAATPSSAADTSSGT